MELEKTKISGVFQVNHPSYSDSRGFFSKRFIKSFFIQNGLAQNFGEEYYSISKKGVLRGMHFQTPPLDHEKLIYVVRGAAIDVVVDLRKNSETYGKYLSFYLNESDPRSIYIPKGCAHGFLAIEDDTVMMYKVTTEYEPSCDSGILWNSFGFDWPEKHPIISERDLSFVSLNNFRSPF